MSGNIEARLLPKTVFAHHEPSAAAKDVLYYAVGAGEFVPGKDYIWTDQLTFGVAATYLESGSGTLTVEGKGYKVKAGDFFLFEAGEQYAFNAEGTVLWIHMDGNNIHEFCRMLKQANGSVYRLMKDNPVPFLMKAIFKEMKDKKPRDGIIGANIASMFCVLFDNASHILMDDGDEEDPVQKAVIYIRQHINEKLAVNQIAEIVSLSPSHFTRLFKKRIGQSPHDYVMHAKIDTAKTILKTTTKSIHEIAAELGYASDSDFVNVFKRLTSFTPKVFRENPY